MTTFPSGRKLIWVLVFIAGLPVSDVRAEAPAKTDGKAAYELSERERKALRFDAGPDTVSLVQFFTSDANPVGNEALKWCSSLLKDEGRLWRSYVPIAMHVRLWDSGGYKDA